MLKLDHVVPVDICTAAARQAWRKNDSNMKRQAHDRLSVTLYVDNLSDFESTYLQLMQSSEIIQE